MTVFVKVCGLSTVADVTAAVDAGADAIGFVFAESPRRVSVDEAARLTRDVPASMVRVAVMRHPTQAEWDDVAAGFEPDWLQTEAGDFDALDVADSVQRMPVFRDVAELNVEALGRAPRVLFEAARSGAGERADWDTAERLATSTQLMLAGGLDPDNVAAAIRKVRPWGVDVSSGVERSRGVKDPDRIAAFVNAVRDLEN